MLDIDFAIDIATSISVIGAAITYLIQAKNDRKVSKKKAVLETLQPITINNIIKLQDIYEELEEFETTQLISHNKVSGNNLNVLDVMGFYHTKISKALRLLYGATTPLEVIDPELKDTFKDLTELKDKNRIAFK
ncbi:hypothetical protein [Gracilinema caldarium]|uniref:hypothetical protein n=1 Tax=Gracilinema caldarium TaxID=215591 RepID=UPI0026F29DA5|nr:hypothetical protein [Gracilinema caldarium]